MSNTSITSRDSQGEQLVRFFEAWLNKANIQPGDEAQYLIGKGDVLKKEWTATCNRILAGFPLACDAAQKILGNNFWGFEDWQTIPGVTVAKEQLTQVGKFPWGETVLNGPCPFHPGKKVSETHFAFLGIEGLDAKRPLTIRGFQDLFPASGQPRFYSYDNDSWYRNEEFANKPTCGLRWYLMLRGIIPGSENKTWDEQQSLVPPEYEVPTPVADVAKHLLCRKKTGQDVNLGRYGRTDTLDSDGSRVGVGRCDAEGLHVNDYWDGRRYVRIGLSASRKSGV